MRPPERPSWPELHARIETAQAAWTSASAGLDGDEAAGEWNALQVHSHVAAALLRYADVLARVAVSRAATVEPGARFLPGRHPYARVVQMGEKGWRDFRGAALTVAKQPDRGAAITTAEGPVDARAFVARALAHLDEHVEQIRLVAAGAGAAAEQPA
jgi:hypothetical protein